MISHLVETDRMHGVAGTTLVALVLLAGLFFEPASAANLCEGQPPSQFQLYNVRAGAPEESIYNEGKLAEPNLPSATLVSRHASIIIASTIYGSYDVRMAAARQDATTVCSVPRLVRIGIGSDKRFLFLPQHVANDECLREEVRRHEQEHVDSINLEVDRFIDRETATLAGALTALKQTGAPDEATVRAQWDTGVRAVMAVIMERIVPDLKAVNAQVDAPAALAKLETACEGRLQTTMGLSR